MTSLCVNDYIFLKTFDRQSSSNIVYQMILSLRSEWTSCHLPNELKFNITSIVINSSYDSFLFSFSARVVGCLVWTESRESEWEGQITIHVSLMVSNNIPISDFESVRAIYRSIVIGNNWLDFDLYCRSSFSITTSNGKAVAQIIPFFKRDDINVSRRIAKNLLRN